MKDQATNEQCFTSDIPTTPGFYWCRSKLTEMPWVYLLTKYGDTLWVEVRRGKPNSGPVEAFSLAYDAEWFGPIPPPGYSQG